MQTLEMFIRGRKMWLFSPFQLFRGPEDAHVSSKQQLLPYPAEATVVRINPRTWVGTPGPALSLDVLGCGKQGGGVVLTTTTLAPTTTTAEAITTPGRWTNILYS